MPINPFTARSERKARAGPTGPSRRRRRALLLGGVLTAGLVGTILVPDSAHAGSQNARPAATATAADSDVTVQYSRGFHIYNLSSHPLKLINISGDGKFEGRPEDGALLMPGVGYHDIEVQWVWLSNQANTATYAILDDNGKQIGTFKAHLKVYGGDGGTESTGETTLGTLRGGGKQLTGAAALTVLDAAGSVRDIPASEGQAQTATLTQLCADDNSAKCTFEATKRENVTGPEHQVGRSYENASDLTSTYTLTRSDEVGTSNSLGISVRAGTSLFDIIDIELEARYDHEWHQSKTFEHSVNVEVPPGWEVWLTDSPPMFRDTGDFSITLGNTTWRLHDVYFDSPNPDGNGKWRLHSKDHNGVPQGSMTLSTDSIAGPAISIGQAAP